MYIVVVDDGCERHVHYWKTLEEAQTKVNETWEFYDETDLKSVGIYQQIELTENTMYEPPYKGYGGSHNGYGAGNRE